MGKILDEIHKAMIAFKLQTLKEMCEQLNERQLSLFNKAFPYADEGWSEARLNSAIDLVERTIEAKSKKSQDATENT